ncbi:hypothetical protein SUDANB120_00057 [Streptomyces sp. enrichment culture]
MPGKPPQCRIADRSGRLRHASWPRRRSGPAGRRRVRQRLLVVRGSRLEWDGPVSVSSCPRTLRLPASVPGAPAGSPTSSPRSLRSPPPYRCRGSVSPCRRRGDSRARRASGAGCCPPRLPYPVDWTARLVVVPGAKAEPKAGKRLCHLKAQAAEYEGDPADPPAAVARFQADNDENHERLTAHRREVEIRAMVTLTVWGSPRGRLGPRRRPRERLRPHRLHHPPVPAKRVRPPSRQRGPSSSPPPRGSHHGDHRRGHLHPPPLPHRTRPPRRLPGTTPPQPRPTIQRPLPGHPLQPPRHLRTRASSRAACGLKRFRPPEPRRGGLRPAAPGVRRARSADFHLAAAAAQCAPGQGIVRTPRARALTEAGTWSGGVVSALRHDPRHDDSPRR